MKKNFFRAVPYLHFLQILNAYDQKIEHFSNLLQKVVTYFLANFYLSLFESHQVLKIEGPNCPNVHCLHDWVKHVATPAWEESSSCPAHASQHQSPGFPLDAACNTANKNYFQDISSKHVGKGPAA